MVAPLKIAISKGRLLDAQLELLAKADIRIKEQGSRKLHLATSDSRYELMLLRSKDLPQMLYQGAADVGFVGLDALRERPNCILFELLDTLIGQCRLVLAAPSGTELSPAEHWRIATSYPHLAKQHLEAMDVDYRLISLSGSVEIAPRAGIADGIVDLVESGATLRDNELDVVKELQSISTWLVCNRASYHTRHLEVRALVEELRCAIQPA